MPDRTTDPSQRAIDAAVRLGPSLTPQSMTTEPTELEAARAVIEAVRPWVDFIFGANLPADAKGKLVEAIDRYDEVVGNG